MNYTMLYLKYKSISTMEYPKFLRKKVHIHRIIRWYMYRYCYGYLPYAVLRFPLQLDNEAVFICFDIISGKVCQIHCHPGWIASSCHGDCALNTAGCFRDICGSGLEIYTLLYMYIYTMEHYLYTCMSLYMYVHVLPDIFSITWYHEYPVYWLSRYYTCYMIQFSFLSW